VATVKSGNGKRRTRKEANECGTSVEEEVSVNINEVGLMTCSNRQSDCEHLHLLPEQHYITNCVLKNKVVLLVSQEGSTPWN
jgi:hypothetical protein